MSKNNQIISAYHIEDFAKKMTMNETSTTRGPMHKKQPVFLCFR